MSKKIKIACVVYKKLNELTLDAISDLSDSMIDVTVLNCNFNEVMKLVTENKLYHYDAFVAGGAYAQILKSNVNKPISIIRPSDVDYIKSILSAKQFGNNLAIASYYPLESLDFEMIETLANVKLTNIIFNNSDDLKEKLLNFDAVIGGSLANEAASQNNIRSVLVYKDKYSIKNSILQAKEMSLLLFEETKKTKLFESIVNFNPSGIITVDETGNILAINHSAQSILNISYEKALSKNINSIISNVNFNPVLLDHISSIQENVIINNFNIDINALLIEQNSKVYGMLITMEKVSKATTVNNSISTKQKSFKAKYTFQNFIGKSEPLNYQINKAKKYARCNSNILVTGETGTGKELFAQSIHNYSYFYKEPFVAINCAALPETLLESVLFGYEEGSFTGGRKGGKKGLFEIANGGTIFLDEIGEMSLYMQASLLRVLQEKEIIRVGGDSVIPINVRIICATNRNLWEMTPDKFREDLYYRLSTLIVEVPPLRERENDVIELFKSFINTKYIHLLKDEYLSLLKAYSWPGNIRELLNVSERFSIEINSYKDINTNIIKKLLISSIGKERLLSDIYKSEGYNKNSSNSKDITPSLINKLQQIYPRQLNTIAEILGISRTTIWRIMNNTTKNK